MQSSKRETESSKKMEEMTLEIDIRKIGLRDKTRGRTKQSQAARQQTKQTERETDGHADILYNTQQGRAGFGLSEKEGGVGGGGGFKCGNRISKL